MSQARALDDDALVIEREMPEVRRAILGSRASSRCSAMISSCSLYLYLVGRY
jgi:hypothetical protein